MLVNTPYDDVFKTLVNDCPQLLIPLINSVFQEHFTGEEQVIFYSNEHFINQADGQEKERVTDTFFEIVGMVSKKYHLECQSNDDSSMLIRMFEYDAQIALDHGEVSNNLLTVHFPHSAVLYLRSTSKTPDTMQIKISTPAGEISYPIAVIKIKNYPLEELFQKHLIFLIPFYIFVHENRFIVYNKEKEQLSRLLTEYEPIKNHLEALCQSGEITEYVRHTIIDMSKKVVEHLAQNYKQIQEGVKSIMGGKILEYPAKTILKQGISQGKLEALLEMVRDGFISAPEAAKRLDMSTEEFLKHMNN